MKLKVFRRLQPFSKTPGIEMLMPGGDFFLQFFPTKVLKKNLSGEIEEEFNLPQKGLVENFKALQNLERGALEWEGRCSGVFFRHRFFKDGSIKTLKGLPLPKKNDFPEAKKSITRFSLGEHTVQEWERIHQDPELKSVVEMLYTLSSWYGEKVFFPTGDGIKHFSLWEEAKNHLKKEGNLFWEYFKKTYLSRFTPGFSWKDSLFLGFTKEEEKFDPFALIREFKPLIDALFFRTEGSNVYLMETLPSAWVSGKLVNLELSSTLKTSLEWRQRLPRRLWLRSSSTQEIKLFFPKKIKKAFIEQLNTRKKREIFSGEKISLIEKVPFLIHHFE